MDNQVIKARNHFKTIKQKEEFATNEKNCLIIRKSQLVSIRFDLCAHIHSKQQYRKQQIAILKKLREKFAITNQFCIKGNIVISNYKKDMEKFERMHVMSEISNLTENEKIQSCTDKVMNKYEERIEATKKNINKNEKAMNKFSPETLHILKIVDQ